MIFGRQNNLHRRAVRPDGRFTRDIRRRGVGQQVTLLDLTTGGRPPPRSLLSRFAGAMRRLLGR